VAAKDYRNGRHAGWKTALTRSDISLPDYAVAMFRVALIGSFRVLVAHVHQCYWHKTGNLLPEAPCPQHISERLGPQ
jgi:hypothetical protein